MVKIMSRQYLLFVIVLKDKSLKFQLAILVSVNILYRNCKLNSAFIPQSAGICQEITSMWELEPIPAVSGQDAGIHPGRTTSGSNQPVHVLGLSTEALQENPHRRRENIQTLHSKVSN